MLLFHFKIFIYYTLNLEWKKEEWSGGVTVDGCIYNHTQTQREKTQNKPTPRWFKISPVLTSLPSVSKTSKSRVMRYCVGATSCQMQFLLGGYSLGHPGLVMDPFSLVMKPPQAAGQRRQRHRWRYPIICANVPKMFWVEQSLRCKHVVLEIEKTNKRKGHGSIFRVLNKPVYRATCLWGLREICVRYAIRNML